MMGFTGPAHGVHGSSERQATQPVLTRRATVHRLSATESFCLEPCGKDAFGFSGLSYTVILLSSIIEDTVCSRQVHRYLLRYAQHL